VPAVTALSMITPLAETMEKSWSLLCDGVSATRTITRFCTQSLPVTVAATVDFYDPEIQLRPPLLTAHLALDAAEGAMNEAGLSSEEKRELAIVIASSPLEPTMSDRLRLLADLPLDELDLSGLQRDPYRSFASFDNGIVTRAMVRRYGLTKPPVTVNTACASGATAIALALDALRFGHAEQVLVVAANGAVDAETVIRFALLQTLSRRNDVPLGASRPFSKHRDGFVLGEGAAALMLETPEHARARGAAILGHVLGYGEAGDGFHRTRTHPSGAPIVRCMQRAIADAGLTPDEIDYVNAHGTSTVENDRIEYLALKEVFGSRLPHLPVSSIKSSIGHALSAAGAIEAVASLLAIRDELVPPTINYDVPDPEIMLDVVPERARRHPMRHVLSNSFGFGGQNVSIVLGAA
jgi:3-oxoacyl-[acyl-carrier-protein] synthase II